MQFAPDEAVFGPLYTADYFNIELTELKTHALAITYFLNRTFKLQEGPSTAVIWATPMDAFSQYKDLYNQTPGPYDYLKNVPVAEPGQRVYPENTRFPLISVDFRGMPYSPARSYGSRVFRRLNWPTVAAPGTPGITLSALGNVSQARMPLAFDYQYQVDHWCRRPDTQAVFIRQLTNAMKASASALQCYIPVIYPAYYGQVLAKLYVNGDIQDSTEKDPTDNVIKYRTTVNFVLEGWAVDQQIRVTKTLWRVAENIFNGVNPADLAELYAINAIDYRPYQQNPVLALRSNLPPGTVVGSIVQNGSQW